MERTQSRDWESQCIQEQPPACTAACPLHVDARGMIAALARQDFAGAFALYARTVPFPRTLSRICDEPCRRACKRNELDEGILVRALEQACVTYCDKPPKKAPLPPRKSGRVAIVGGSLPGLVAAADLARKGYLVTIFEAGDRLGGRLWNYSDDMLPRARLEEDLALCVKYKVPVVITSLGARVEVNEAIHSYGGLVLHDIINNKFRILFIFSLILIFKLSINIF